MQRTLYGYFRSSAAFRIRIALNLKALAVDHVAVNLMPGVDGQHSAEYRHLNPQGRVPFYSEDDFQLAQSPAILEYLEDCYPDVALLPADPREKAYVRQLSALIACDVHPLNNLSVLTYIKAEFGADKSAVKKWYAHWIGAGFTALEAMIGQKGATGRYSFGDEVTLADVYLVPQLYNARRFSVPLDKYPRLRAIDETCMALPAFQAALPEKQPDAV